MMRVFTLDFPSMIVNTRIMRQPSNFIESRHGRESNRASTPLLLERDRPQAWASQSAWNSKPDGKDDSIQDSKPAYWIDRGALVGAHLGAVLGSVIPIAGTLVGWLAGAFCGSIIGFGMWAFSTVTRSSFPADHASIERRERVACLSLIWISIFVLASLAPAAFVYLLIPGTLGSAHTLIAGTPTKSNIKTGDVSAYRRQVCVLLPWAALATLVLGFWVVRLNGAAR
jgi:hypothetical protein